MRPTLFLSVFASLTLACAGANAQILLDENFEDGGAEGWAGEPGKGSLGLTQYGGNISLRLVRDAAAVRAVALSGVRRVEVSASFAAANIEGDDACLLEFSSDGQHWREIGRLGDGMDDGVTLHEISGGVEIPDGAEEGYVGVRIKGNARNDTCWADNIKILATPSRHNLARVISEAAFIGGATQARPFATSAFSPSGDAIPLDSSFEGKLRFFGEPADHFVLRRDEFGAAAGDNTLRVLPPLEIGFVEHGGELIPLTRGPMRGNHPDWEWIVEPGRIWTAPEGGLQASFPFALQERNANCVHNGLAAFRISADGVMSHLVYQIGSETCAYMQFDLWGAGEAEFAAQTLPGSDKAIENYEREKAARLETRPVVSLAGLGDGEFGSLREVKPEAMTLFGYIDGDVLYASDCKTRYGAYPFCDVMDLPSYSWAKSIVAGIAAMRLEKLYPGAMSSFLRDYVPDCNNARWDDVTFEHALDMATGIYNSDVYDEDEKSAEMSRFFLAESHDEKIKIACTAFARKGAPGEKFVYRTSDTYLLGAAMNAFLREKSGNPDADFYDDLLVPIWRELGLSPLAMNTRRTRDKTAQPFTGWGLTLHRNDIALIARFLRDGGVINGDPVLDERMLAAALQENAEDRGLAAVIAPQRYNNGFWAWNAGPAIGCGGDLWIPAMSGYGGLSAAFMPNGALYFYISDGGDFSWRLAAIASNNLDPFCETAR